MTTQTLPFDHWALATVETDAGAVGCLETPHGLFSLTSALSQFTPKKYVTVFDVLNDWQATQPLLARAAQAPGNLDQIAFSRRLAPILFPGKVVCAGANYFDHLEEMGVHGATKENQRLFFFMKPPRNAIVGEGPTVHMPFDTEKFDWEVELAAVIGKRARNVTAESAHEYIAGYTVGIDLSARDLNQAPDTFYKLDWNSGKGQDTCGPIGPRIVPSEAFAEFDYLNLQLRVNNELKQNGTTENMVFPIAELIAKLSRIMTLDPGDLIFTGTPSGVGVARSEFLNIGDRVTASIDHIGEFTIEVQPPA